MVIMIKSTNFSISISKGPFTRCDNDIVTETFTRQLATVTSYTFIVMATMTFGFFTIGLSDAFLSDYLTDLKLHSTK